MGYEEGVLQCYWIYNACRQPLFYFCHSSDPTVNHSTRSQTRQWYTYQLGPKDAEANNEFIPRDKLSPQSIPIAQRIESNLTWLRYKKKRKTGGGGDIWMVRLETKQTRQQILVLCMRLSAERF